MTHSPGLALSIPAFGFGQKPILAPLALQLPGGRTTAILGASGSGKSTLLRLVAGLLPIPSGGRITADDGQPVAPRVAWMAQQDLLLPWRDVLGNLCLGATLRGQRPDLDRAHRLLDAVGLSHAAKQRPAALSGGMRQRAALARTLMEDRPFVLMDEPFSAVDAPTRHRLQGLAAELLTGRTVLLVTHDPLEALRLAHQVIILRPGPSGAMPEFVEAPGGEPPRPARDPALAVAQGELLDRLAAMA
ncbi:ABC transporter ATP-binding protein [Acetobacteraceae bacterium H6797]|nr:ABC transporter ATP-binding protein [Acetobacteraceae bacterium H6797]